MLPVQRILNKYHIDLSDFLFIASSQLIPYKCLTEIYESREFFIIKIPSSHYF